MHVTEAVLEPLRKRYGRPALLEWEGEISEREHAMATYNPRRMHDVTLFILNGERLALIRKPQFEPGVWRPPGEICTIVLPVPCRLDLALKLLIRTFPACRRPSLCRTTKMPYGLTSPLNGTVEVMVFSL